MHLLIAPNAFKNSLSAEDAAEAIEKGVHVSSLKCTTESYPIADGGDGTGKLIIKKFKGRSLPVKVNNPIGKKIQSSFGLIEGGKTAVIEMSDASGIKLLRPDELDPLHATTYGTGELIKHALDKGVSRIIMGVGGSATTDGGCGILSALGIRFLNAEREDLKIIPEDLSKLAYIDASGLDARIANCELTVLCDVENTLTGPEGTVNIFAQQKGATAMEMQRLQSSVAKFTEITLQQTGIDISWIKYGGAAGGTPAGLFAFLNARLVSGIDYFLEITGFEEALRRSDIIITGEGSIDEQTLKGKGPFGVACRAKVKNLPVIGIAGKVPLKISSELQKYFDVLVAIGNEPSTLETALNNTSINLIRTSGLVAALLQLGSSATRFSKLFK